MIRYTTACFLSKFAAWTGSVNGLATSQQRNTDTRVTDTWSPTARGFLSLSNSWTLTETFRLLESLCFVKLRTSGKRYLQTSEAIQEQNHLQSVDITQIRWDVLNSINKLLHFAYNLLEPQPCSLYEPYRCWCRSWMHRQQSRIKPSRWFFVWLEFSKGKPTGGRNGSLSEKCWFSLVLLHT